jgi:2-phospho-L-lactate guanylyltransferase
MNTALAMPVESAAFRPWAVVPAKALARAKSRLDPALAPHERRQLATHLLARVLHACTRCAGLAGIVVATDGDDVAALAARAGARVVRDPPGRNGSLADIVDLAIEHGRTLGATHALVVMADLPLLQPRDLGELLHALRGGGWVLAPDAQRRGTNALGLPLTPATRTCFGRPDSLTQHAQQAERLGARVQLQANPRLALDLDTPADLRLHASALLTARSTR